MEEGGRGVEREREPIEIRLRIAWDEFRSKEDVEDDWQDDEPPIAVSVYPVGESRFEVVEPTSLTCAGCFGPQLKLGTMIEATPEPDGTHRYIRSRGRPRVWTRIFHSGPAESLQHPGVRSCLQKLLSANCAWEFFVGNITIQGRLAQGSDVPSEAIVALLSELRDQLPPDEATPSQPPQGVL